MFRDVKSLWEFLAAIMSTPVLADFPFPEVLLQVRHLRGNFPFLPNRLTPQQATAQHVKEQLQRQPVAACFNHGGRVDVRGSTLVVGQKVRYTCQDCDCPVP